jgi:hypothetical protein
MKKVSLYIIGYLLLAHFAFPQNNQTGILKKIEGTYYFESYGKDYPVNPSVVTVKLKNGLEQSKIVDLFFYQFSLLFFNMLQK